MEEATQTQETEEVQTPVEPQETEETQTSTETEQPEETPKLQAEKKPKKSIEDRIKEISARTWEMRETERRIQKQKDELEQLQKQLQAKPPKEDDYDDVDKFQADKAAYEQRIIEQRAEQLAQQRLQEQHQRQQQTEAVAKWEYAKEQAIEKDPQWMVHEAKVERALIAYNRTGYSQPIVNSPKGADIVSYFGKNPDHLERFVQLTPEQALKEIGILEYKLGQKPVKKNTPPPEPPINPVTGSGSAGRDLNKMSYADFEAYRNKQEKGF